MDEFGVVKHIKSFRKINCPGQCTKWGMGLIKALSYFMCKRKEVGYGGVAVIRIRTVLYPTAFIYRITPTRESA